MADLVARTLAHYRERFERHGATPAGVDWNGIETQRLQFDQLLRLLPASGGWSLNDLGCGYGALVPVLAERFPDVRYHGYDVSSAMIASARRDHARDGIAFDVADRPLHEADFTVASGIFTLRLERSDDACLADMLASLDTMDRASRHGFAFNCLTSYSDADRMKDYLYYPHPGVVFDLCKQRYARNVALLHDYGLYAFTILVRKTLGAA